MKTAFAMANGFPVEVWIKGERPVPPKRKWAVLQMWDEKEFVDLLSDRLGKSKAEVRRLLESYSCSESKSS